MNTLILSLIRTYVPIIVGALVAWLITVGINLDENTQAGLIVALTGVLQALYYFLVRLLEQVRPGFGVLLGVAKTPDSYSNDNTIVSEVVDDTLADYPESDDDDPAVTPTENPNGNGGLLIPDDTPGKRAAY